MRRIRLGWVCTRVPTTQNVARAWLRFNRSRIFGVFTGSGPSSKVSATSAVPVVVRGTAVTTEAPPPARAGWFTVGGGAGGSAGDSASVVSGAGGAAATSVTDQVDQAAIAATLS